MLAVNFLITETTKDFHPWKLQFGGTPLHEMAVAALRSVLATDGTDDVWTITNLPMDCFGDELNRHNILSATDSHLQERPRWALFLRLFRELRDVCGRGNAHRDVLLLNGMNPLLSAKVIRTVVSEYRSSPKDVLSSAKHLMDNHPALNWIYYADFKEGKRLQSSGGMDAWERFAAPDFWKVDRATQSIICACTGKPLTGRQQLPSVYELDGNFLLFKKERLEKMNALLMTPETLIFPLRETISEGTVFDRFSYFKATLFYNDGAFGQMTE
jgi:hypothetical protein